MQELVGDIFDYVTQYNTVVMVPINGVTKKLNGHLVMGAGIAKQAAEKYPDLPRHAGRRVRKEGLKTLWLRKQYPFLGIIPTKVKYWKPSDPILIRRSLGELKIIANDNPAWTFIIPQLGCGTFTGGLTWETQVKPLVEEIISDMDNIWVIDRGY